MSVDTGRNLTEALNMVKKQDQLEAEVQQHSSHIKDTLNQGKTLVQGGHRASKHIQDKCQEVRSMSLSFCNVF